MEKEEDGGTPTRRVTEEIHHGSRHRGNDAHIRLISQVAEWIQTERRRLALRRLPPAAAVNGEAGGPVPTEAAASSGESHGSNVLSGHHGGGDGSAGSTGSRGLRGSVGSVGSVGSDALDKLEQILSYALGPTRSRGLRAALRPRLARKLSTAASAAGGRPKLPTAPLLRRASTAGGGGGGGDVVDGDILVPECDAMLDHTRTLGGSTGAGSAGYESAREKEWTRFKEEIVRLAHTLGLKGWRRIPLDRGGEIEVERLSGALTNAVYVVSPPRDFYYEAAAAPSRANDSVSHPLPKKRPAYVLPSSSS